MSKSVVIIDDCSFQRNNLKEILRNNNYEVIGSYKTGDSALEFTINANPAIIILDFVMAGSMGDEIVKTLRTNKVISRIIMA